MNRNIENYLEEMMRKVEESVKSGEVNYVDIVDSYMEKLSKIVVLQIAEEAERNGHPFSKEEDLQKIKELRKEVGDLRFDLTKAEDSIKNPK